MIYLQLFLEFFKIGITSFGGGYGMISIIRDTVLTRGWMSEDQLINFIAVAESTPGPIAVNMATFIGSEKAGIGGAVLATFGVVLPAFLIILLIASIMKNILKYAGVQAVLSGIRPCIVALIMSTALVMGLSRLMSINSWLDIRAWFMDSDSIKADYIAWIILVGLFLCDLLYYKIRKKKISAIALIVLSAAGGMLLK